uniref:Uncharacterized protein n=1 Tax=Picea glauca TaxID=3330 RepID=A0A101M2L3_PICGL|nr:hypothetical protein ABT39_MTgene3121 [Picea glauca]QHR86461.1 hypothetical protein Q903MT_gene461 [Picea sitchensis]
MCIKEQGGMYQNPEHVIDVHINLLVIHRGLALLLVLYLLLVLVLGINNIHNHLLKQLNQLLGQEEMLGKVVDLLVLDLRLDQKAKLVLS